MEKWKPLDGFFGLYEVSDKGRIKSVSKVGSKREFYLKQQVDKNGYMAVRLSKGNKKFQTTVHRAVAKAFVDNSERKPCVNHKDGDKKNNCAENLEWVTYSENTKHAWANGLIDRERGVAACRRNIEKARDKQRKAVMRSDGKIYRSIADAAASVGVDRSVVSRVLAGKKGKVTAGGYRWTYV